MYVWHLPIQKWPFRRYKLMLNVTLSSIYTVSKPGTCTRRWYVFTVHVAGWSCYQNRVWECGFSCVISQMMEFLVHLYWSLKIFFRKRSWLLFYLQCSENGIDFNLLFLHLSFWLYILCIRQFCNCYGQLFLYCIQVYTKKYMCTGHSFHQWCCFRI
jgi:hypothetical protein